MKKIILIVALLLANQSIYACSCSASDAEGCKNFTAEGETACNAATYNLTGNSGNEQCAQCRWDTNTCVPTNPPVWGSC